MSVYTEIRDAVFAWTNRPTFTTETDLAIRHAVRAAHRAGTFYRDLVTTPLVGQSISTQIQTIDLSSVAPMYRQLAYVKPTDYEMKYDEAHILDLFDLDKQPRLDVYWVVGNTMNIRAAAPAENITLCYYKNPTLTPIADLDSWIAVDHPDLIICSAAASIFAAIGEQEIKARVEAIAKLAKEDLIADNLFAVAR